MKRFLLILIILLNAVILSCSSPLESEKEVRVFYARQFDNSGNEAEIRLETSLVATSNLLEVYVKSGYSMSRSAVNKIINDFERDYQNIIDTYGDHTDVDGNGKIIIVFFDVNKSITGDYVAGYFYSGDLLEGYGNDAEILYIEFSREPDEMYRTLIHEFQHLINYNMTIFQGVLPTDTWLNEALSESTEILCLGVPRDRILYFNYIKERHYGNYFYTWNGDVVNYAAASVFMYWLYIQSGSSLIFKDIAKAPEDIRGYYVAVEEAVKKNISSLNPSDWKNILLSWFKANYLNDASGLYGYKNSINFNYTDGSGAQIAINKIFTITPQKEDAEFTVDLYPGAAIYYKGTLEPDTVNVKYIQISQENNIILVFNYSTELNGVSAKITIPPLPPSRRLTSNIQDNIFNIGESVKIKMKPMPKDKIPLLRPVGKE